MTERTLENLRLTLHQLADALIDVTRELSIQMAEAPPVQKKVETTDPVLPDVLTVREAAKVLRVGANTIYEAVQRKQILCVRMGRRILIPKVQVLKLLNGEKV